MSVLVLDNYDSFTYNLVDIIRRVGFSVDVFRNDQISVESVAAYQKILLSPGPGIPEEAGIMKSIIGRFGGDRSILGVCLGHQGIAEVYGARLFNLDSVLHGVLSTVLVGEGDEKLFRGLPATFEAVHYHSWAISPETLGDSLQATATNEAGIVMAIRHRKHDVRGVQFHPESILTKYGFNIIENWLTQK
ncbi:MAG: aminodeoxychorismate/anthranilate synthase component II [Cytophagales bacterium]|nr:aminodeoxychorismate/anthranilate synthase component II [Cytophagales bacterium]